MIRDAANINLLIIEDNMGDFTLIKDYLEEQFVSPKITHAKNFTSAKSLLDEQGIKYDVILLDLSLPDKSGEELINEVRSFRSECQIIVLTGFSDIDFSIRSLSMGVSDYLLKDDINATSLYKSIIFTIERRKTNLQLVESEKRFSNLFHMSPQPMWVFELETYRFIQVNEAAVDKYGYSENEFLNMTILDIRPVEEIQKVKESVNLYKSNSKSEDTLSGRFVHLKKSGEPIEVEVYSNQIILDGKLYRSVIAVDVTEKILFEQRLTKAIIKAQEDERYEIGGELHDNVCQILAISQISLGMLQKSLPQSTLHHYELVRNYINMASVEIRNLSHRLAPVFFEDSSLYDSFEILLKNFNIENKYDINLYFDNTIKDYPLARDMQLNLFRILQEQLRNIFKYAEATTIEIDLVMHKKNLKMRIADNGVGFDMQLVKDGIGLTNMKRRTELFSGKFNILSSPGQGCEIIINIPIQE